MGTCPSDASGFRFYEELDLEKGTPVSAAAMRPARVPWGSLLQTARLASTRRASADLWAPGFGLTPHQRAPFRASPGVALSGLRKLFDQRRKFEAADQMSLKALCSQCQETRIPHARREAKGAILGEHKCSRDFAKGSTARR